jgi:hypothetical protein
MRDVETMPDVAAEILRRYPSMPAIDCNAIVANCKAIYGKRGLASAKL